MNKDSNARHPEDLHALSIVMFDQCTWSKITHVQLNIEDNLKSIFYLMRWTKDYLEFFLF